MMPKESSQSANNSEVHELTVGSKNICNRTVLKLSCYRHRHCIRAHLLHFSYETHQASLRPRAYVYNSLRCSAAQSL